MQSSLAVESEKPGIVEDECHFDTFADFVDYENAKEAEKRVAPIDAGCGLTMMDYVSVLHGGNEGWITLAEKIPDEKNENLDWKQWHYRYSDIDQEFIDPSLDSYISMNTFCNTQRTEQEIYHLNAFYVDIDFYKFGLRLPSVVCEIKEDLISWGKIPAPTLWMDSGNGLYLVWKIETVPGQSEKALTLYEKIHEYLVDLLSEYGADPLAKDGSRVLRIAGTRNSKTGRTAQIIEYNPDAIYTMREFIDEYLPQRCHDEWFYSQYPEFPGKKKKTAKRKQTKAPRKPSSVTKLKTKNIYTLHKGRINDLLTLCNLRGWKMTGHREFILFLLRYWTSIIENDEKAIELVLDINSRFTKPLPDREVLQATKSADRASQAFLSEEVVEYEGKQMRRGYNYKNESLIGIFEITPEEQKHLSVIISTEVKYSRNNARKRAERRNEDGLTTREQQKQSMIHQVSSLLGEGLKQKQIAEKLGITTAYVSKIVKELKKLTETALYIRGGLPGTYLGGLGDLDSAQSDVNLMPCEQEEPVLHGMAVGMLKQRGACGEVVATEVVQRYVCT